MKKLSIVVPVYNVEKYLNKCLDSLANQTLDNYEVIVVNDGTKDNSQAIIDDYVAKYPTIFKSYIKDNGGLSDARNYGIRYATGEYITFLDSDDYIEYNTYQNMLEIAYRGNHDLVVADLEYVWENGKLPVVNFAAGGIATPADAALMMQLGSEGVFVGSGIFKSGDPEKRARAIVLATTYYNDPIKLAEVSEDLGKAISGINYSETTTKYEERGW